LDDNKTKVNIQNRKTIQQSELDMSSFILAIDQGTTSSRAILFDRQGQVAAVAQQEFAQHFPHDGWIEHNPEDIWETVVATCRDVMRNADISADQIDGMVLPISGKPLFCGIGKRANHSITPSFGRIAAPRICVSRCAIKGTPMSSKLKQAC